MGTIVVGLDGSDAAEEAFRFAVAEAKLRAARLRVVRAWVNPSLAYAGGYMPSEEFDLEGETRASLAATVSKLTGGSEDVEIEQVVREGHPTRVLVEEAAGAEMLVVGSRGLSELLLGSVSHYCVQHAHCPVVVIRARDEEAATTS